MGGGDIKLFFYGGNVFRLACECSRALNERDHQGIVFWHFEKKE